MHTKDLCQCTESHFFMTKKAPNPTIQDFVAEKEGFEPSLRLSHTTPLAGEPLRPLGYFSMSSEYERHTAV